MKGWNIPTFEHVFLFKMKKHFSNIFNSVYVQGKQTQEIFKGTVGILREQRPITVPPDIKILPGTPWYNALRLSCQLSQRSVCCFSVHLILSSPFPKGRSHGCYGWAVIHPVMMGSLRKTFHTVVLPCYNNSQVLIFLTSLALKSSDLWCLEIKKIISWSSRLQPST